MSSWSSNDNNLRVLETKPVQNTTELFERLSGEEPLRNFTELLNTLEEKVPNIQGLYKALFKFL
jgi:hypothetical protein